MQQFSIFIYPITKYHPEADSTNFDNHVLSLFKRANKKTVELLFKSRHNWHTCFVTNSSGMAAEFIMAIFQCNLFPRNNINSENKNSTET
jgi:hypothetical protein